MAEVWNEQTTNHDTFRKFREMKLWPTPRVTIPDNLRSNPEMNDRGRLVRASGEDFGLNLADAANICESPSIQQEANGQPIPPMSLNPVWVEWLMGFPPGFTDLEA
jgi:hypothetical protein